MELSNAPFLPSPDDTAHGHAGFDWIEDGAVLVINKASSEEILPRRGG